MLDCHGKLEIYGCQHLCLSVVHNFWNGRYEWLKVPALVDGVFTGVPESELFHLESESVNFLLQVSVSHICSPLKQLIGFKRPLRCYFIALSKCSPVVTDLLFEAADLIFLSADLILHRFDLTLLLKLTVLSEIIELTLSGPHIGPDLICIVCCLWDQALKLPLTSLLLVDGLASVRDGLGYTGLAFCVFS